MNKINIVIPMAGAGLRFQSAGFHKPKPFIKLNGKMMIEHVLDSVQVKNANYFLVIQEKFLQTNSKDLQIISDKYQIRFVLVEKLTQGASCTALAAHKVINNNVMVVFVDSDNFFNNKVFNEFITNATKRKLDGSLLTFQTNLPCYSFAEIDKHGYVLRTKEKDAISNHAICGVYLFAKGSDFVSCAINMMIYGDKTKNEYYMSNVFNHAIRKGLKIGHYDINETDWQCVGTPEQLKEFCEKDFLKKHK